MPEGCGVEGSIKPTKLFTVVVLGWWKFFKILLIFSVLCEIILQVEAQLCHLLTVSIDS